MLPNLSTLPIEVPLPGDVIELIATDARKRSLPLATITLHMSSDMGVTGFHGMDDDRFVPRQSVKAELSIPISIDPSSPLSLTDGELIFPGPQSQFFYITELRDMVMQTIDQLQSDGKYLNRATDKKFAKTRNEVAMWFDTEADAEGIWHLKFVISNESVEQMKLDSFKSELELRKKEEGLVSQILLRYLWHPYVQHVIVSTLTGKKKRFVRGERLFKALAGEEEGQDKSLWGYHFKVITPEQAEDRVERKAQFQLRLGEAGSKFFQNLEFQRLPTRSEVAELVDVLDLLDVPELLE